MRLSQSRRLNKGDSIIPLINIVFLLLVFFLLAGTLTPRPPFEMEVATTELKPPSGPPSEAVFISARGVIAYRGAEISPEGLTAALAARRESFTASNPLELVLDRRLKAGDLLPVTEALSAARIEQVRIVTERSVAQ